MVRSVGRGLDPSAGDCPGDGRWREVSRGVGDAAPYGLPGDGWLPRLTLPTSGTARFSSPLGVDDFVKKSSFIYYTRDALGKVQSRIADFAEHEGLHAHAKSVTIRFEDQ